MKRVHVHLEFPSVIENQKGVAVALDRAQVLWFSGS